MKIKALSEDYWCSACKGTSRNLSNPKKSCKVCVVGDETLSQEAKRRGLTVIEVAEDRDV